MLAAVTGLALASGARGDQLRAIFDLGQSGELPPVVILRDYASKDSFGAPVGPNQPRWGQPQIRAPLQEWRLARATTEDIAWMAGGYDRNGTDPMLCYLRRDVGKIDFWINARIDDGDPTFVHSIARGPVLDVLVGTPGQRDFHAYHPRAGVALPGCFLFACERWHDENQDPQDRDWQVEGISVVAAQRDGSGSFGFEIVGDGPRLNNDDTALGDRRGRFWSMTAYYPFSAGHPLLRAFVPVVDYLPSKKGGQVFLFEAARTAIDTAWQFGALFMIDEHVEDGTHFHTAAWTPRGVVAAMGDGVEQNENLLYTCTDWDAYDNPARWTKHERAYGAGTHPDQPTGTAANQFVGAAPGRHPNRVLVAGDLQGGSVYECTVPENPAEKLTFTRLWGEFWTSAADATGHLGLWFHRPAPERLSRAVSMTRPNGVTDDQKRAAARILYSDDALNFMTVARLPSTLHWEQFPTLYGEEILLGNWVGSGSPQGIWAIPAPETRGPRRGLSVAGGGTNALQVGGGGELLGVTTGGGTTLTLITDGLHPVTGEPLEAPGFGPLYRVVTDGSGGDYLVFNPTGDASVAPGFVYLPLWFSVLGPQGVVVGAELSDAGPQVNKLPWRLKLTNREQWVPHTVMFDAGAFAGSYTPQVRLFGDNPLPAVADFIVQVEGYYAAQRPPYPTAPGTTSPPERVTQPLGSLGDAWTIGVEAHVPHAAEDWLAHPGAAAAGGRLELATAWASDEEYVEIYADLEAQSVGADVFSGGAWAGTASVGDVSIQRHDRIWIGVSHGASSGLALYAWSGGSTESGFAGASSGASLGAAPSELRFGVGDFSQVPALDVLMVAVDTQHALGRDGLLDLLSTDGGGSACHSDLDGDGGVDVTDFLVLIANWGCSGPGCVGDIDGDGVVGVGDFLALLSAWGTCQ
ncbi:MAG: hypothetical protein ACYTGE_15055 [Planctomycetota bacterium]